MKKQKDILKGAFFLVLTFAFVFISMTHKPFFDWAFERHQNPISWYIRPLFLIPFCFFAYKRSLTGVGVTTFCLFTSMFWFPKPEMVSSQSVEFLQYEKEYLQGTWNTSKIILTLLVPISMTALALAFWKRSLRLGIGIIILIAIGKILWSILNAGESGYSILVPAIIGLFLCVGLIYWTLKKLDKWQ